MLKNFSYLSNKKFLLFFLCFCVPLVVICEEFAFSVVDLISKISLENDLLIKKKLLIEGINVFNSILEKNSFIINPNLYELYIFQYHELIMLKNSLINQLLSHSQNIDSIPEISKPKTPIWFSLGFTFSGWVVFIFHLFSNKLKNKKK